MGNLPDRTVGVGAAAKAGAVLISVGLLTGCANLFSGTAPAVDDNVNPAELTMTQALEYVSRVRKEYRKAADTAVGSDMYFDIPTILLGAAATASAVVGSSPILVTTTAGGAASVLGLKTYANTKKTVKILLKGEVALLCVEQHGFAYDKLSADPEVLKSLKRAIEGAEGDAGRNAALVRKLPNQSDGLVTYLLNQYGVAKKAAKVAKQAIDDAMAASVVRAQTVYFTAKRIENKVATLLVNARPDAKAIAKGLAGTSKPAKPTAPAGAAARMVVPNPLEGLSKNLLALEKAIKQANKKGKVFKDAEKAINECGKDLK